MTDFHVTENPGIKFEHGHFITTFEANLRYIDEVLTEYVSKSPALTEAGEILLQLNKIKRDLSVVYDSYSKKVLDLMGDNSLVDLPSGGSLEKKVQPSVKNGKTQSWRAGLQNVCRKCR